MSAGKVVLSEIDGERVVLSEIDGENDDYVAPDEFGDDTAPPTTRVAGGVSGVAYDCVRAVKDLIVNGTGVVRDNLTEENAYWVMGGVKTAAEIGNKGFWGALSRIADAARVITRGVEVAAEVVSSGAEVVVAYLMGRGLTDAEIRQALIVIYRK